jgi:hypothetical protein
MHEPVRDAVMPCLTSLEWENRRWKGLGRAAVALLGLVVLIGATKGRKAGVAAEVRARHVLSSTGTKSHALCWEGRRMATAN